VVGNKFANDFGCVSDRQTATITIVERAVIMNAQSAVSVCARLPERYSKIKAADCTPRSY